MIGVSLMLYGIGAAFVQGVLVGPVIARLGQRGAVMFGLLIEVATFGLLGFISSGLITLILTPFIAIGNVGLPALQGIVSQTVPDDSQGELQGVLSSITSIGMIIGHTGADPDLCLATGRRWGDLPAGCALPVVRGVHEHCSGHIPAFHA